MQPQIIAARCADSGSGDVRAPLAAGVPCNVLTGGPTSPGILDELTAFFRQVAFSLDFPFMTAVKLSLILHWQPQYAPQCFAATNYNSYETHRMIPGNANLPIGDLRNANREIGVPGIHQRDISLER